MLGDKNMKIVWKLPCASQEFMESPTANLAAGDLSISYDFEQEDGEYGKSAINFNGVESFNFTLFETCKPEQVDAYDKLLEIEDSALLAEHQSRKIEQEEDLRHYRIFFDEIGCYDVLAKGLSV